MLHSIPRVDRGGDSFSVVVSPVNADIAYCAFEKGMIVEWHMATNTTRTLIKHTDMVMSLAMNSDGSRLYSGSYGRHLLMWDTTTRTVVKDIECASAVQHLIVDESVVYAAVNASAVIAVDGVTGDIIATYAKAKGWVFGFALRVGLCFSAILAV